jgi:hypothetical protein
MAIESYLDLITIVKQIEIIERKFNSKNRWVREEK